MILVPIILLSTIACIHHAPDANREPAQETLPAQIPGFLPDQGQYTSFYETAKNLDFTRPGTKLKLSSGGTSVYAVVEVDGRAIGAILPENAATKISGEIAAFSLGRALGAGELFQPGAYHYLTGANLRAFRQIIPSTPFSYKWKEMNRQDVLAQIAKSPNGIPTVFKKFGAKPVDYDAIVRPAANSFNAKHVMAGSKTPFGQFLSCRGVQPSKTVVVTANGGTSTEYAMAKQLSTIFLVDALTQQWDRFSGGNLQTATEGGKVRFTSNDNGGTWSPGWTKKFLAIVTRFDRQTAQRVLDLNRFLNEGGGSFLGIRTEAELAQALGLEKFPVAMRSIKRSIGEVAGHIQANPGCFFED